MKIYTKTGDRGETSLFGGDRVSKAHPRLDAYGTLDELNALLGWFRARTGHEDLAALAASVQSALFDLGAHLATPPEAGRAREVLPPLPEKQVAGLEEAIDRLDAALPPLSTFILPGGDEDAALLHVARAVARRGEREVVRSGEGGDPPLPAAGLAYLNRLSDLLFVMARTVNHRGSVPETPWTRGPGDGGA